MYMDQSEESRMFMMEEEYVDDYDSHTYYDPDMEDLYENNALYEDSGRYEDSVTMADLVDKCLVPILNQTVTAMVPLMIICFMSRLVHLLVVDDRSDSGSLTRSLQHIITAILGLVAAYMFFEAPFAFLVILALVIYVQMCVLARTIHGKTGPLTAGLVITFVVSCELFIVGGENWHRIRGAQMVLSMKVISLGFDLDQGHVQKVPSLWAYCGYVFHPGSIVFGPWVSYKDYLALYTTRRKKIDLYWVVKVVSSSLLSLLCVLHSTCSMEWLTLDGWGRWVKAYWEAQSFRFSHYFVTYISEMTNTLSGIGSSAAKPMIHVNGQKGAGASKQLTGEVRWDMTVTRPFHIELPRSLSEVVSNWNLPMHYWLRNYVFRPSQHLGTFPAILLTYMASAILHGLNFQLAAVLLSLGSYSYVEHQFRHKLSKIFDACIGSKRCKDHCDHRHKASNFFVMLVNIAFGLLTIFHLTYLGVMFDNSERQEQGYTMEHTLNKWGTLNYASHLVAMGTYIVFLLI